MKFFRINTLIVLFMCILSNANAQYENPDEQNENKKEKRRFNTDSRLFFGGNLGLSFWGEYAYVEVSPLIGYKITPRLWAGGGPKYLFIKLGDFNRHIYGPKLFTQFAVLDKINETINIGLGSVFIYGEYELLSMELLFQDLITQQVYKGPRTWHNIVTAGFGLRFPIGQRSGFSIMVLWGLTESARYLYDNPEIRLSIDI